MNLKTMTIPAANGEPETYRLMFVAEDRSAADAACLIVHDVGGGAFEVEGCPHCHPTPTEALDCPEARITLGELCGGVLPPLQD